MTEVGMKQAKSSPGARAIPARGGQLSRKERRELARQIQSDKVTLEIVHANAAGIDVGKNTHYVAVPPRSRCRAGSVLRQLHGWPAATGGVAEKLWDYECGSTVDRSLLDRLI